MNKSKWLFTAGIAGSIGLIEYRRYMSFLDTVSTSIKGLKIKKEGSNLSVFFQLIVDNKSSKSIDVQSLVGSLYTGSLKIGDFKINQSAKISSNSKSVIPLTVLINPKRLLNDVSKYNSNAKITLKTKTVLNFELLGLLKVPVNIKNITTVDATEILKEVKSFVSELLKIFKK